MASGLYATGEPFLEDDICGLFLVHISRWGEVIHVSASESFCSSGTATAGLEPGPVEHPGQKP